jgi:hypothetical protein
MAWEARRAGWRKHPDAIDLRDVAVQRASVGWEQRVQQGQALQERQGLVRW